MKWQPACVLLAAGVLTSCAGVGPFAGNDTGGIIAWSRENQLMAREISAGHCARYNKRARITSVHARYGDYIGFVCFFPRDYDPVRDAGAVWRLN